LEPNSNASQLQLNEIAESYRRVRSDNFLKKLVDLAGKYRRVAQSKQRMKVTHGMDDIVGVNQSGDIGRALPIELSKLVHPVFKKDALRRFVEKQLMSREFRGVETVGKGPIVVCVDESGSMAGQNITNAKAFALAMAWIARNQRRSIVLMSFSSGRDTQCCVIQPGKWNESHKALLDWLKHFYQGGTTLDVPLKVVPEMWPKMIAEKWITKGKTDQIIISDGIVDVDGRTAFDYKFWKEENKVKTITIVLGSDPGKMNELSDEVYCVNAIEVDSDAVSSCFSI
jgi:uncharacterized protein with von Willebrand factor type A (vWA) domain